MQKRKADLDIRLAYWGRWKRTYLVGLSYASETIEYSIMKSKGELLGNGCKNGGKKKETINGVSFKDDEDSQRVDNIIKRLRAKRPREMQVLLLHYVWGWSIRKIHSETEISRYELNQLIERGKQLVSYGLL